MSSLVVLVLTLAAIAVPLEGKWELKKNVYVVEMDMRHSVTVELVCDVGDTATSVKWQKGSRHRGHGRKLSVTITEIIDGGNYTCHDSNGKLIGYNFVYIKELVNLKGQPGGVLKQRQGSGKFIHCEAKNYNGSFYCSWELAARGNHQFVFRAQHGSHSQSIPIKCSKPKAVNKGLTYTASCDHSDLCPYGEEHTHVEVFLNATQENKFSSYTDTFYIRNILKPDPPENPQVHKSLLSWCYPTSWSSCTTFFPLLFNVSVLQAEQSRKNRDAKPTLIQTSFLVNGTSLRINQVKQFCIQAKDPYYPSSWSNESCTSATESKPKKGRAKKNKGEKRVDKSN